MFKIIENSNIDGLLKTQAAYPKYSEGVNDHDSRSNYSGNKRYTTTTSRLYGAYETSNPGVNYKQGAKETRISFRQPSSHMKLKTDLLIREKDCARQIDRNHLKPLVYEYQARRLS